MTAPAVVSLALRRLFRVHHLVYVHVATVRAARMIAPTLLFQELDSGIFVSARNRKLVNHFVVLRADVLNLGQLFLRSSTVRNILLK